MEAINVQNPTDSPPYNERNLAMLKALAHPIRLQMVEMVKARGGEVCVCEFEAAFPMAQSTISHHLKKLRDAGVLTADRKGIWIHHSLEANAIQDLESFLSTLRSH
ncbi:helix-turn-helix transcriptional regulator [bacterium]|nr:helix-turn-helix transcriptional regulator [bacterium]